MKINRFYNKNKILRALVITLELLALGLALYLIFLPFYPVLQYRLAAKGNKSIVQTAKDITVVKTKTEEFIKSLPQSDYAVSPNRLIITKIGVNAPIVESKNEAYGLDKGAWHFPDSSTPVKGGNTIITGHRFKYLPPNNMTFYLLDKLEKGDIISVIWQDKEYYYRVAETKVVPDTELSILNPSDKPIITLFTCTPIYSTEKRLVVIGELIEDKK
jgi:sortase A